MIGDVPDFYEQRERADSFGSVAEDYDRYRPNYPGELMDRLAELHPAAVLDVGCGTGKASRQLIARGLSVLGVEPDAKMAEVARRHGVPVELGTFEEWDDRGRTFDLIVSGQAWHWVDPARGAPKLVRLLRPGGTVCLFWNSWEITGAAREAIDDVYRRLAPALSKRETGGNDDSHGARLRATGCFGTVDEERLDRERMMPVDELVGRTGTHSDHLMLGPERLAEVLDAIRAALAPLGDAVPVEGGTYVVWARP